jgi:hypothetical protein
MVILMWALVATSCVYISASLYLCTPTFIFLSCCAFVGDTFLIYSTVIQKRRGWRSSIAVALGLVLLWCRMWLELRALTHYAIQIPGFLLRLAIHLDRGFLLPAVPVLLLVITTFTEMLLWVLMLKRRIGTGLASVDYLLSTRNWY